MNKFGYKHLVVMGLLALMIFPASAGAFDVKLSGQVSELVMYANDGDKSDLLIGDNDNSSSRVKLDATEKFDNITIGGTIEIEGQVNPSDKMVINRWDDGDATNDDYYSGLDIRKVEAYLKSGFGKISLGQGSTATDGTAEVDLSGTTVALFSNITATAGGFEFKKGSTASGLTVKDTRSNYDGLGRTERVRYDSPTFVGVTGSASISNGGAADLAVRYAADFFGNLEAALGYASNIREEDYTQISGSVSYLLPFGLNFTVAVAQRNSIHDGAKDPLSYYGKVGYKFGIHAVALEYGVTQDKKNKGDVSSNLGLGYVVQPWKKVELFAAARQYMLDLKSGSDPDPILQVYAGTRIKF